MCFNVERIAFICNDDNGVNILLNDRASNRNMLAIQPIHKLKRKETKNLMKHEKCDAKNNKSDENKNCLQSLIMIVHNYFQTEQNDK